MGQFDNQSVNRISQAVRRVERMPQRPAQLQKIGLGGTPSEAAAVLPGTDPTGLTSCAPELWQAGCAICPCTCDPWLLVFTPFACSDLYEGLFPFASEIPVFYSAALSNDTVCVWVSQTYVAEQYSWVWQMTATSNDPPENAEISGNIVLLRNGVAVLSWSADRFCCACETCFTADCNLFFPLACPSWPREICLGFPLWSLDSSSGFIGESNCCSTPIPAAQVWASNVLASLVSAAEVLLYSQPGDGFLCFWVLDYGSITTTTFVEVTLHYGPCDGNVYLDAIGEVAGAAVNASWSCPVSSWSLGTNTMTLYRSVAWVGSAPYTITVSQASVLTDTNGNVIVGANGQPILELGLYPCDPSQVANCCYRISLVETGYLTYLINLIPVGDNSSICPAESDSENVIIRILTQQASLMLQAWLNTGGPDPEGVILCAEIGGA